MLDKLPNEVLHLVFEHLATSPDFVHDDDEEQTNYHLSNWKTLVQLCKVSRQMRRVAEPLLYRHYAKPDSTQVLRGHHLFRRFLDTVLNRPELLQYIRCLYIGAWSYKPGEYDQYEASNEPNRYLTFPDELCATYNDYAGKSALGDVWKEALLAGEEAAEIALLMSLTPNLEHIEFCMPDLSLLENIAPQYFWPSLLIPSAKWDPAHHFHRLDSVMIHKRHLETGMPASDEYGFEVDPLLLFIGLPKLKVFWVEDDNVGAYQVLPEDYPLSDKVSHLTDLTLGLSCIHPMKLIQILKRCTKLEAFDFDFQPELEFVPGFSWNTIGEALRSSCDTLEELTLSADMRSQLATEQEDGSEGTCVSIGSLRNFTSLRKLDVLQTTLLGFENMLDDINLVVPALPFAEMLPSSLESLTIDLCTLTIVPYLEDMSTVLKEQFPNLKEIRLSNVDLREWDPMDDLSEAEREAVIESRKDRVKRLKEDFVKAGVQWL
ncbi:hypothetical protein KCU81_g1605, partial [Aureobasidium melanogenum]|uniref:Leucine-rich repeat domain-containing protein n=1 Tax=Aureobasidium melanogenum (strain CBS 110374) TaxID=1043003 RepID=A0A074WPH2_AURM1